MIKANRVLLRIIAAHLFIGVLLTAVLLAAVSAALSGRIERTQAAAAEELLQQTCQTASVLISDAYGDFYTLWTRSLPVRQVLAREGADAATTAEASAQLASAVRASEIVHSVQLINRDTGLVLTDQGSATRFTDAEDPGAIELLRDFALNFDAWHNEVFFPRTLAAAGGAEASPVSLLSVIFATRSDDGDVHGGLVVNIDRARLARATTPFEISGQLLMLSPDGRLIADLSGHADLTPADASALKSMLSVPDESGSLIIPFAGERSFLVYQRAVPLGFVFVRVLPYRLLEAEDRSLNRIVVLLFVAAILVSLIASAFSVWVIYHPLSHLVRRLREVAKPPLQLQNDEYAILQSATDALLAENQRSALVRLINGQADAAVLDRLQFSQPAFLALAMSPDHAERTGPDFIERVRLLADTGHGWQAAVTAPDNVSVVLNGGRFDDEALAEMLAQARALQAAVLQQLGESIAIGCGLPAAGSEGVRTSHRQALAALQQALLLGEGQLARFSAPEPASGSARQSRDAVVQAIIAYIDDHLGDSSLTPEAIAEHVGLSVGYMRQLFRSEQGGTVSDYLVSRRIGRARVLLADTDLTARQIAEQVGYPDSRYFYTVFRKQTGETTDAYRRRIRADRSSMGNDV